VRRIVLSLAAAAAATSALAVPAGAAPPQAPPGCDVVLTTPASVTGAPQAQANKQEAFVRVCLGGG
jgi:ABC-type glycerol-3-phosphate transport system substrate-binding protein